MKKKEEKSEEVCLDDILEKQWEMQDKIHRKCKIKDDPKEKIKRWKQKYR